MKFMQELLSVGCLNALIHPLLTTAKIIILLLVLNNIPALYIWYANGVQN